MEGIRVYFEPNGRTVVDLPCGVFPDRNTLERISDMIRLRGEAVA